MSERPELHVPLDFERLPEFRLLCAALDRRKLPPEPKAIEQAAAFLWHRLWVELGYLAQKTNQPGKLTAWGVEELKRSVSPLYGDCDPLIVLCDGPEECRVLRPVGDGTFQCDLFARHNAHLAGDYLSGAQKGNIKSTIVRQQKLLRKEATQQGVLLRTELFKRRDGMLMDNTEQNKCMILVRNLDNCLRKSARHQSQYTDGMMADAHAVVSRHEHEELLDFYAWLYSVAGKPGIPDSTEKILERFAELWEASKN